MKIYKNIEIKIIFCDQQDIMTGSGEYELPEVDIFFG